ncbi:MAG: hypothetical protein IKW76_01695 [Clostridia bacterium]|nr:hypothetical protein [Clostridia bacterium]
MARLMGTYTHNLDQQNRLAIPTKVRAELGDSFVLTVSPSGEDCLLAYSFEDWDDVMQKLIDEEPSEFTMIRQRMISINTVRADIDAKGRITIPTRFMEKAGFREEVYMLGNGYHLELWAPDKFDEMLSRYKDFTENQKTYFYK